MANPPLATPFAARIAAFIWKFMVLPFILRGDGSFSRRAADFFDRKTPAIDAEGVSARDLTIDDQDTDLWVRIFTPSSSSSKLPVIFFFHGGFFALCTPASPHFDALCRNLATACAAIVISVNYRRIPEHRYPAAIDDGFQALKYFQQHSSKNALLDLSNTFLVGDSAGGNLVHNLSSKLALAREDLSPIVIRGQVLIQPSFGGESLTPSEKEFADVPFANQRFSEWRWRAYLPPGASRDHSGCNPFGGEAPLDLAAMAIPPTLVVIGGSCPGQDRHAHYVDKLIAAGKEAQSIFVPGACHGFYLAPKFPHARKFCEDIATFVKIRVASS
ncbi:probable carboxylesterase 18 [Selaginella moellendorffii]|nr:probable carboxylesterase 18 [Selaginella moellendorffii]|eukprot:XP_002975653.2 probable carboxylesterase 18 [Selaginella moellendorffii]